VLITLWEANTTTASEIGFKLNLDLPTITPVIGKLERMGFISRARSVIDKRVVTVTLTKKGDETQKIIAEIQNKVACKTHLAQNEFNKLKVTLNDLTKAMELNSSDLEFLKSLKNRI
jgi:MarR family transcriptional regulator, organic hydroperoxide resistance regulator